ncbi:MAG: hypothetical protein H6558_02435 [Lewinellaceae bacterium]|nr:hypothetical protein [Lewinellaceae bacterium]MCB9288212.1 hypothetical protein [Lewinellaceae bacterium]
MLIVKRVVWTLVLLLLCAPMLLQLSGTILGRPLKGWQPPPEPDTLSWESWSEGQWQGYAEEQARYRLNARPFLARLNNQLKYSLFGKLNAHNIFMGKNGYLYEGIYIWSYLGMDYQGEESIAENVAMLESIADSLKANGSQMLFVLASGKATFMPENLPPRYDTIPKRTNNYETYRQHLLQSSIPTLDLNQYLLDMKDTASYKLYTKGNTHWSAYALYSVTDTLLRTIEQLLHKDLPDYYYGPLVVEDQARGLDDGIFQSLNLLWTGLKDEYAYRDILLNPEQPPGVYRPKVWVIGDSFYGTLMDARIPHRFFSDSSLFFYYFNEMRTLDGRHYPLDGTEKQRREVEKQDLILIFITDGNIGACCWGMTGTFFNLFN